MTPTTLILSLLLLAPGQTLTTCKDGNCLRFPNAANLPMTGLTVVASSDPAYARLLRGRVQVPAAGRPVIAVPVVKVKARLVYRTRRGLFGFARRGR